MWTVDMMAIEPDDRVLEIGCGHGVAVSLVCERLAGGHVTAIDRSATMIAKAAARNADAVAAGVASFQAVPLDRADFGGARFDKVFAVHVGVFLRGDPIRELAVIRDHLAPDGLFHLVDQPLDPGRAEEVAAAQASVLRDHGFAIRGSRVADLSATRVACTIAGLP